MKYQDLNAKIIDGWCEEGWEWGLPISHEVFIKAKQGEWNVVLTPTKNVPHEWFGSLKDKKVLGLASGGGQQIPIFSALGAKCCILDYSTKQCESERMVAQREGYEVEIVQADMSQPLPFEDERFDLIFHPVSSCYIEEIKPLFKECYRILKKGGIFLAGFDNGINYLFDEKDELIIKKKLPYNPLKNKDQFEESMRNNWGIQFSHSLEEIIGGQIEAGFTLTNLYEDTNGSGELHEHNVPTFIATRSIK